MKAGQLESKRMQTANEMRLNEIAHELSRLDSQARTLRGERDRLLLDRRGLRPAAGTARYEVAKDMFVGGATYAAIGRELGCSGQRAKQIITDGDRKAVAAFHIGLDPMVGISVRTANGIKNLLGLNGSNFSREHVLEAAARLDELKRMSNFGKRCASELTAIAAALQSGEMA